MQTVSFGVVGDELEGPESRLASERLELLVEASRISTSQLDPAAATRAILWRSVPILADCGFFDVIGPGGRTIRAWSTRGGGGSRTRHASWLPTDSKAEDPVARTARTRQTQVWFADVESRQTPLSAQPLLREPTSVVSVPLAGNDDEVGVLTLCFAESRRRHTTDDVLVAEELGRRISAALEHARLRGRVHHAAGTVLRERERFDIALRSQEVLVEAGTLLASSFDYRATLQRIVELTVPRLADYCFIHTPDGDGRLHRVAERYHATNPLADFKAPLKLPPASPIMRVLRTGASVWLETVTDGDLVAWSQSDEHLAALRGAGPKSLVAMPLIAHGRLLGTMVFATNTSDRTYDQGSVALFEQLAQRAAWALDAASLRQAVEEARRDAADARREAADAHREAEKARAYREGLIDLVAHEIAGAPSQLVEDLLDVSACASGSLGIERVPVDLAALASEAFELARRSGRERRYVLQPRATEAPLLVLGDPFRLRQIVGILLSNALELTDEGDEIALAVQRSAEGVDVVVTDGGRGIPREALPGLFRPFSRDAEAVGAGLGLGLAIARQILHMHGGTISVTTPGPGLGTSVVVSLPTLPSA
jgi:signal transduction histidine kinase